MKLLLELRNATIAFRFVRSSKSHVWNYGRCNHVCGGNRCVLCHLDGSQSSERSSQRSSCDELATWTRGREGGGAVVCCMCLSVHVPFVLTYSGTSCSPWAAVLSFASCRRRCITWYSLLFTLFRVVRVVVAAGRGVRTSRRGTTEKMKCLCAALRTLGGLATWPP